ncbi:neuromedin-B receptor-like [Amphiura filiformis]|uniref:neuromedin-B receptor-like n=1 Tax=Amphiura filiformis TaxID=82378 RepID=UPI003B21848F
MSTMDSFESNITDNGSSYTFDFPEPTPKLELAFTMTLISIVGILGNASIIFIILRHSKMRTTTNLLVANLAVGDLSFFIMHPPLHLYFYFTFSWPFGSILCKSSVYAQNVSEGISVFTLTALSIERYQAIVRPMQLHTSRTPYRTIIITIVIWLLALVVASPTLEMAEEFFVFGDYAQCKPLPHLNQKAKVFKVINFMINFAIPLIIITLFYCLTALQLMRSVRAPKSGVHAQCGEAQRRSRMKLALVVLSLVIAFVICWSPYYVYELWFEFGFSVTTFNSPAMINFTWWRFPILYLSSCINPIILYTISSSYRNYFYRHFCCCLRLLKKPQEPTSMTLPSGHTRLSEHTKSPTEASTTYAATTRV